MQDSDPHILDVSSLTITPQQSCIHPGNRRSKIATSPCNTATECSEKFKVQEQKIDIADEQSILLGLEVFTGKLSLDKTSKNTWDDHETGSRIAVDAEITSKALTWGSHVLRLADVISVSYVAGLRQFVVHAFPVRRRTCGLHRILKPQRKRMDFRFLASNPEEAFQWVMKFSDRKCFINCLPHPMMPSKKQASATGSNELLFDHLHFKSKSAPKVLVILNPRSGNGRSSKVFHNKVEPIFQLAGFTMEIIKTASAGHARNLAATIDFGTCPNGIICIGGDGLVNEVLNGLLSRGNQKEALSIPVGIIPAGSDNSLVWTVLRVRDPISAAITIIKGGLTAMDILAVEWIQTGSVHYGTTVAYFGFLSDVLELSEKYQKHFGPLRYFVAGFLKFLCLPKYSYELEYLPKSDEVSEPDAKVTVNEERIDMSDLYTDIMRKLSKEGIPRPTSSSTSDSITPSRISGVEETTGSINANNESSDYVRYLDSKSKRLSQVRTNLNTEPEEVLHSQLHLSTTPNMPRTRSKSRTDKGWTGISASNDSRCSWAAPTSNDKEDLSSTISDPGPIWDSEPKWDNEPNWEAENPIHLPDPLENKEAMTKEELVPNLEHKWVVKKGQFIAVLVCNHSCKTVQSLSSQVIAPKALHDDNSLDLLLVHGSGRMKLLRFFILLQFGRHLSLPFVEYVKVRSVKLRPGKNCHSGCGIDGELFSINRQVVCHLLPGQCKLIGCHPARDCV